MSKTQKWILYSIVSIAVIIVVSFCTLFYLFFRENPKRVDEYKAARQAVRQLEEEHGSVDGMTMEQIIEHMGDPAAHYIESSGSIFETYDVFADKDADEYIYYVIGESMFSARIYIIGFKDGVAVGGKTGVEDW